MLKYCKINFFNDKIFQKDGYRCSFCLAISSQSHLKVCWKFENIRLSYNLEDENDTIDYLIEVIKLNQEVDEDGVNEVELYEEEHIIGLEGSSASNRVERDR